MLSSSIYGTRSHIGVLVTALCAGGWCAADAQTCSNGWSNMFPGDGFVGSDPPVYALAVHDAELYLGGQFGNCMERPVNYVARWNGRRWAGVGAGLYCSEVGAFVYSLAVFDDPNTPEGAPLYAGALDGVYKLPTDLDDPNECWPKVAATNGAVRALAVYEGALYAGGEFTCIGTADPNDPWAPCDPNDPNQAGYRIARWGGTGSGWEVVGVGDPNDPNTFGMDGPVFALTVFDDGGGDGEALFAGGRFTARRRGPRQPHRPLARRHLVGPWRRHPGPNNVEVDALAGWVNGSLYVGGTFSQAGGVQARRIAAAALRFERPTPGHGPRSVRGCGASPPRLEG